MARVGGPLDGFIVGLALTIAAGQLHKLFGIESTGEYADNFLGDLAEVVTNLDETVMVTMATENGLRASPKRPFHTQIGGRGGGDRTRDLMLPKHVRYRCATPRRVRACLGYTAGHDSDTEGPTALGRTLSPR